MKNYVLSGDNIDITAAAAVASGGGVLVGKIFGVATTDIALGSSGSLRVEGVFDLTKSAGVVFAQGDHVYWDDAAKAVTSVSAGNTLIGIAWSGAAAPSASARVRLNEAW